MKIVNFIIFALIKSFLTFARIIPMGFTFWWMRRASRLAFRLAKGRRRLMMWNLKHAYGDRLDEKELERIAGASFENLFISMAELIHMDSIMADWQNRFTFEGEEIVERLIKEGRGFFIFGGHYGGWTMPAIFPMRFPQTPGFNMVARPLRNPRLQGLLEYMVGKFTYGHGKLITTRGTGQTIVEVIGRGEIVGLYMDQESRRKQGVFIKFFGQDASSHVVPGYLAWKHAIPLVPFWIPRTEPGRFHVIFREPLDFELTQDAEQNNLHATQAIACEVERAVRERPEQWLWAHNRWRRTVEGDKRSVYEKKKKGGRGRGRKKGSYLSSEDMAARAETAGKENRNDGE